MVYGEDMHGHRPLQDRSHDPGGHRQTDRQSESPRDIEQERGTDTRTRTGAEVHVGQEFAIIPRQSRVLLTAGLMIQLLGW